jgi:hypothetical protein
MRLVQVRDLLAGQGWFDLTATRLDPPGTLMHWSRLVDIPLVLLIKTFGVFTDVSHAERLARLAYPELLLAGLYAAVAAASMRLTNAIGAAAAIFITFASAPFAEQFQPGRIDHHSADIVLLVCATGAILRALDPMHSLAACAAAVAIAVSLGISIETLPLLAITGSALPLAFILQGERIAPALAQFALTLGAAMLLVMLVTTAPNRWTVAVCDAASAPHYLAIGLAALGLFVVARSSARLTSLIARLTAIAAIPISIIAALALFYPGCLGDPFIAVDPLVKAYWLSNVSEAMPAWRVLANDPPTVLAPGLPLLAALVAAVYTTIRASARDRAPWLFLSALLLAGTAMCVWQVRYFGFMAPLAALAGGAVAARLANSAGNRVRSMHPPIWALVFCLPFAPSTYVALLPSSASTDAKPPIGVAAGEAKNTRACLRPEMLQPLNALPQALLLGPIDSGGYLLAETHHAVVAGAYHRNNRGNRRAIEIFTGPIDEAEVRLRYSGARYVLICREQDEVVTTAKRSPDGLLARLLRGNVPSWLRAVPVTGTVLQVYELADRQNAEANGANLRRTMAPSFGEEAGGGETE